MSERRPNKKKSEGEFGDTKENIDKCLSCTKVRCNNCLSNRSLVTKQNENPGEYVNERLVNRCNAYGWFSTFCAVLVYALWKEGFTDKSIAELIGCHPQTVYTVRKKNGFTLSNIRKLEQFKDLEALLPVLSAETLDFEKAIQIYPALKLYKDERPRFKNRPWLLDPPSNEKKKILHAAVYKLWKAGYSAEDTAQILSVSENQVWYYRRRIGLGSLRGGKTREDRYLHAAAYLNEFKDVAEKWDSIVKECEKRHWNLAQSNTNA